MDKQTSYKSTIVAILTSFALIGKAWIPELEAEGLNDKIELTIDQLVAVIILIMGMFFTNDKFDLDNFGQ